MKIADVCKQLFLGAYSALRFPLEIIKLDTDMREREFIYRNSTNRLNEGKPMETIVRNPSELGRLANKTRMELGLRQSDLHAYTTLATRFIGEVEHGRETAQIGKVMDRLESLGLEIIIRKKLEEAMDSKGEGQESEIKNCQEQFFTTNRSPKSRLQGSRR